MFGSLKRNFIIDVWSCIEYIYIYIYICLLTRKHNYIMVFIFKCYYIKPCRRTEPRISYGEFAFDARDAGVPVRSRRMPWFVHHRFHPVANNQPEQQRSYSNLRVTHLPASSHGLAHTAILTMASDGAS